MPHEKFNPNYNRVVQKLQFMNNNRLKKQNVEHFAGTCEVTSRVIEQVR
jgi:hypothetical protein